MDLLILSDKFCQVNAAKSLIFGAKRKRVAGLLSCFDGDKLLWGAKTGPKCIHWLQKRGKTCRARAHEDGARAALGLKREQDPHGFGVCTSP